ncbi:MAG: methyltransferase domain-containing protein [Chromatiales bacterium]|jgi:SAM-dependent methyltransferase|nr:methyltransferase domain-containing protein [Chromatiales bacterium]
MSGSVRPDKAMQESTPGRAFEAYQSFVLGMKLHWTRKLYPRLRESYDARVGQCEASLDDHEAVAAHFANDLDYAFYAWFERHLQRMKYSGQRGLVPTHEPVREVLEEWLDGDLPDGLLSLDPNFSPPRYFTGVDIHQHPGGVCGDTLAGVIYERASRTTTPLIVKERDLHFRFTKCIEQRISPTRVVDLGCGFGKSTQPLYSEFPHARVTGVDLSAPCLKLAARMAAEVQATNVIYRQASAEATQLPTEDCDLVTSTMMLHEMPPRAITAMLAEAYRLLIPGGYAIHLDFLASDDPFERFIHYGHARRNNEPYMPPLNEMDIGAAHQSAGFEDVTVSAFEELPGALAASNRNWRFPWALIVARKPGG